MQEAKGFAWSAGLSKVAVAGALLAAMVVAGFSVGTSATDELAAKIWYSTTSGGGARLVR